MMSRGHKLNVPFSTSVYEACYGAPAEVEYYLGPENESSFFDNTLSVDLRMKCDGKVATFLSLHPWFCTHIVFVWKVRNVTHNILIESFYMCMQEPDAIVLRGLKLRPISALLACDIIEESRQTIEKYDGTNARELKDKYDARKYFDSGLIPRLDI